MSCSFRLQRTNFFQGLSECPKFEVGEGCQFEDAELIEAEGKEWCRFHLPLRGEDVQPLKAGWDQAKAEGLCEELRKMIWQYHCKGTPLDLSGVVVPGALHLEGLPRLVYFDGAVFGGEFTLKSEKPVWAFVSFVGTEFQAGLTLVGMTFEGMLNFGRAVFRGPAEFRGSTFKRGTYFYSSRFEKPAGFQITHWSGESVFIDCAFEETTNFYEARFASQPRFLRSRFGEWAGFEKVVFEKGALFGGCDFAAGMSFPETEFGGWANFSARFLEAEHADVPGASFRAARFRGDVTFQNRRFRGGTSFANAHFAKAPTFHGGEIHQDTDFSGAVFEERSGFEAARAYRTLRLEMERWRARLEESRFFELEQEALRRSDELSRAERTVSWLYEKSSRYGGDFRRPLLLLIATQIIASLCILAVYLSASFSWEFNAAEGARFVRFLMVDMFTPFGVARFRMDPSGELLAMFKPSEAKLLVLGTISALRTIGTVVFFSLLLLAIRRRFRIS